MSSDAKSISIDELGRRIGDLVATIGEITVIGHITNSRQSDNGWYNFRIASDDGNFCEARARVDSIDEPCDGDMVKAVGKPHLYRRRNVVQISIQRIEIIEESDPETE